MALFRRSGRTRSDPASESLARAVPASATVVSARQMSRTAQDGPSRSEVYVIELLVHRPGVEDAQQTVEWTVFDIALTDIARGVELSVTVDPVRPAIVYPPGYPPPNVKPGVISLTDARILPTSAWLDRLLT